MRKKNWVHYTIHNTMNYYSPPRQNPFWSFKATVEFLHLTTNLLAQLAASMSTTVPVKNILTKKKKSLLLAYTRPKKRKKGHSIRHVTSSYFETIRADSRETSWNSSSTVSHIQETLTGTPSQFSSILVSIQSTCICHNRVLIANVALNACWNFTLTI